MKHPDIGELVRSADPYAPAGDALRPQRVARAEADLARILADGAQLRLARTRSAPTRPVRTRPVRPRPVRSRRARRPSVVLAVAVTIAAVVALLQPWSGERNAAEAAPAPLTYRVVDSRPARAQLLELAQRTRALSATPPSGPVLRVRSRQWGLVVNEQGVIGGPSDTVLYRTAGQTFVTAALPASEESSAWLDALSTDAPTLRRQLARQYSEWDSFMRLWIGLEEINRQTDPTPGLRAALLTVLADQPGLTADGVTTDRAGRRALGFSRHHDGVHKTFLVAAGTGALLAMEDVADVRAKNGRVKRTVTSYQVFLARDYLDSVPR